MEFHIINQETKKIYKEKGKELKFNNFNLAINKLNILKINSDPLYKKLIIKQISDNQIKYFNEKREELFFENLNENKDPIIKIKVNVSDDEIDKEWNNQKKLPIDDLIDNLIVKKNIKKDNILINLIYIHNILYNLENGKELLNKKIFDNSKNNLIYFGEKLIESINQIDISMNKINLNYDNVKYY